VPASGSAYYGGGEEVLSAADASVNLGVLMLMELDWQCAAQECSFQANVFFVSKGQQGSSVTKMNLFFNNNTWSASNGVGTLAGRFEVRDCF
jgi:hypothetical protein